MLHHICRSSPKNISSEERRSPFLSSNPPGQGTGSGIGMSAFDITSNWANQHLNGSDIYNITYTRDSE
jgi:hypothetical protein